jgi:lysophospholipase L1-like esterase
MSHLQRTSSAIRRSYTSSTNRRCELLEPRHYLSTLPLMGNPTTANAAFVEAVYQDVLGRQADSAGLAWGTALVNSGQSRAIFIEPMVYSDEASTHFIRSVYQQYLGREADAAGLSYWLAQMHAGVRNEQIEAAFLASDEFYARAGGTQVGWIQAAYQTVYGRSAEPQAVAWASSELASGQSRHGLAFMIVASTEGLTRMINHDMSQFKISIDQASVSSLVSQLSSQQITEQQMDIDYLASAQYFDVRTGVPVTTVPVPNTIPLAQTITANITSQAAQGGDNVVFVGDSITEQWTTTGSSAWSQYFAPLNSLDGGVGGDTTQNVLWRLEQGNLHGTSPKLAVVMIGINNVTEENTPSDVAAGISAVVRTLQSDFPGVKVLLLGILPAIEVAANSAMYQKITQINQMVVPLADGQHVWFLDEGSHFLNPDGSLNENLYQVGDVHPNAQGYQVLAQAIAPWVQVLS